MSKEKLQKIFKESLYFIVWVPLIVGIHWGWMKLQDNPKLVDPANKRELPFTVV